MNFLSRFFFITLLVLSALGQSTRLLLFLMFRNKTLLTTLCFGILFILSIVLVIHLQSEMRFHQQLRIQHSQLQRLQVERELMFWTELSVKVPSPHIYIRISELHTWLGNAEDAQKALNIAKALDPQISVTQ